MAVGMAHVGGVVFQEAPAGMIAHVPGQPIPEGYVVVGYGPAPPGFAPAQPAAAGFAPAPVVVGVQPVQVQPPGFDPAFGQPPLQASPEMSAPTGLPPVPPAPPPPRAPSLRDSHFGIGICKHWAHNGYCTKGDNCKFVHAEGAQGCLDGIPVDRGTKGATHFGVGICRAWQEGQCQRGDKCKFVHSEDAPQPEVYVDPLASYVPKSATHFGGGICFNWKQGLCSRGEECKFLHSDDAPDPGAKPPPPKKRPLGPEPLDQVTVEAITDIITAYGGAMWFGELTSRIPYLKKPMVENHFFLNEIQNGNWAISLRPGQVPGSTSMPSSASSRKKGHGFIRQDPPDPLDSTTMQRVQDLIKGNGGSMSWRLLKADLPDVKKEQLTAVGIWVGGGYLEDDQTVSFVPTEVEDVVESVPKRPRIQPTLNLPPKPPPDPPLGESIVMAISTYIASEGGEVELTKLLSVFANVKQAQLEERFDVTLVGPGSFTVSLKV